MSRNQNNITTDEEQFIIVDTNEFIQASLNKRNSIIKQVQRFGAVIAQHQYTSISALKLQLEKVSQTYDAFESVQLQLENNNYQDNTDMRVTFDELYFDVIGKATDILEQLRPQQIQPIQHIQTANSIISRNMLGMGNSENVVKLPALNLPTFDGDFKQWTMFKDAFQANISSRSTLSNNQKFQYLRGQLKGEAFNAQLMRHLHIKALFDIPMLVKPTYTQLRQFLDSFNAHLRSLEKLACQIDSWGNMLIAYLIESKLDYAIKKDWEKYRENKEDDFTVEEFIEFLTKRCKILKKEEKDKESKPYSKFDNPKKRQEPVKKITLAVTEHKCEVCQQQHRIYFCPIFLRLDCDARIEKVKKLELCCNCLLQGHIAKNCTSSKCKKCNMKHNTLLHKDNSERQSTTTKQESQPANSTNQQQSDSSSQTQATITTMVSQVPKHSTQYVLLATAIIQVADSKGHLQSCRVLIDPGSQSSYVTQELVDKLKLHTIPTHASIGGINMSTFNIKGKTDVPFTSCCSSYKNKLECLNLPKITQDLPHVKIDVQHLTIPTHLALADPDFNNPSPIDMLMGADIAWHLLTNNQIKLNNDQPLLQESHLGWLVTGPMCIDRNSLFQSCHTICVNTCLSLFDISNTKSSHDSDVDNIQLLNQLEKFWSIEEPFEHRQHLSEEEQQCENHFVSTYQRHEDGKFIVRLPLNENSSPLGCSKKAAMKRFISVERRMLSDENLRAEYVSFMKEYENLRHMSECREEDEVANYLPHHPVQKPSSETTKLRIVFDGSAKTESGTSLNDIQLIGPKIQTDLFNILLRFRQHTYVMTADIEKMYRMIWVHPEDRHFQQILWRDDPKKPIRSFKLSTVTYGLASSPFLAIRCVNQLAQHHKTSYPKASKVIIEDFYVDDLLTGTDDIVELQQTRSDIISILKSGGFNLRKWKSNVPQFSGSSTDAEISFNHPTVTQTLGLSWDPNHDLIKYSTKHDSMVTLYWIHKSPSELKVFVANRVAEIQRMSNPSDWHYVPTKENPADVLSRGKFPSQLLTSELWWNGPSYLQHDPSTWPSQKIEFTISEGDSEIRKVTLVSYESPNINFLRFSSIEKLKRTIAICLRWTQIQ